MSLIIFAIVFTVASGVILIYANYMLSHKGYYGANNKVEYITNYVKGTARGNMGLLESRSMLETKRTNVNKKHSKF